MRHNIPAELRRLPQWVVANMAINPETGKPFKNPLNPRTGQPADVTDPSTWGTFTEAEQTGARCIGYVLAASDPYSIIDLDAPESSEQAERHTAILSASSSYAEYSQSRTGLHLILRGSIPHGVRRDRVEVYSHARYMICTGDVFRSAPIKEEQGLLDTLFREMASTDSIELVEEDPIQTDEQIMESATQASNADKLCRLVAGHWQGHYPSQSEADFALMTILAFYSRSNEQCRRLFRSSALGERDKAQRDKYLNYMLGKIRAKQPLALDFSLLIQQAHAIAQKEIETYQEEIAQPVRQAGPPPILRAGAGGLAPVKRGPPLRQSGIHSKSLLYPPGLIGDIARYFHKSNIRPADEISIASALALAAGICGRSYNISGTGLNQYIVLLASTGSGKEGAAGGIERLIAAVRQTVPMADNFMGPARFASGQGMVRVLDTKPCFISVLGEFGILMGQMCDPRAPDSKTELRKIILDAFGKSGFNQVLRPSAYSDTEKNTALVQAPNISILGESTPEEFYGNIDSSHILSGLLPRFSIVEYKGQRPDRNKHAFAPPEESLITAVADLCTIALTCKQNSTCQPVGIEPGAQAILDAFDEEATGYIRSADAEVERHLWNRAHLKALKLGALLAVGKDMRNPVLDGECARWALAFVRRDVESLLSKFKANEVSGTENKQEADLRRAIKAYLVMTPEQRKAYKVPDKLLDGNIIPYHYFRRWARRLASFTNDRRGAKNALEALLEDMVAAEALVLIGRTEGRDSYALNSAAYTLGTAF